MVFDEKVPKYFYPQNINQLKLDQGKEIKKSIAGLAGAIAGLGLLRGAAIAGAIAIAPIAGPIAAGAAAIGTLGNIYIAKKGLEAIGTLGNIYHQRKCEVGKFCCNCKKKSKEACKHGCGCEFCKMP